MILLIMKHMGPSWMRAWAFDAHDACCLHFQGCGLAQLMLMMHVVGVLYELVGMTGGMILMVRSSWFSMGLSYMRDAYVTWALWVKGSSI